MGRPKKMLAAKELSEILEKMSTEDLMQVLDTGKELLATRIMGAVQEFLQTAGAISDIVVSHDNRSLIFQVRSPAGKEWAAAAFNNTELFDEIALMRFDAEVTQLLLRFKDSAVHNTLLKEGDTDINIAQLYARWTGDENEENQGE